MNTQGPCPPFALGVWKGTYLLLPPLFPQHSLLPLLPRLLHFVYSPSHFHPLFATCTGGYSPFPMHLKRGGAPPNCVCTCTPFPPALLCHVCPHSPSFAHIPPTLVCMCAVRHTLRVGGKHLCANRDGVGGLHAPLPRCVCRPPPLLSWLHHCYVTVGTFTRRGLSRLSRH